MRITAFSCCLMNTFFIYTESPWRINISAHSSKESQAAYKAIGCVHAEEINQKLAEEEPCDVQLEYVLDQRAFMRKMILWEKD